MDTKKKCPHKKQVIKLYSEQTTSASTSAWLLKVDFLALKIGMYTVVIGRRIQGFGIMGLSIIQTLF